MLQVMPVKPKKIEGNSREDPLSKSHRLSALAEAFTYDSVGCES